MTGITKNIVEQNPIEAEAIAWHTRVHYNKLDIDTIIAFEEWLNKSSSHKEQYEKVKAFHADTQPFIDQGAQAKEWDPLLNDFDQIESPDVAIFRPKGRLPFANLKPAIMAIAAMLLVAFVLSYDFSNPEIYETTIAQKSTIQLSDGSKVLLNTNSQVEVDFDGQERLIRLTKGQGYFQVAKDANRPFIVSFEGGQVTALGTEFDIYLRQSDTQVTLLEGTVKVERMSNPASGRQSRDQEILLTDGKQALQVKMDNTRLGAIKSVENSLAVAWQMDNLVFDKILLGDVIYELGRYSRKKIILEDFSMSNILISGTFSTNISESLNMLERYFGIKSLEDKDGTIILINENDPENKKT